VLCTLFVGALMLLAPAAARADIVVDDVSVTEGSGGTATFTITRTAGLLAAPVTVSFHTADGSAHSPADFVDTSGTADFRRTLLPATQVATVAVPIADDRLDEPSEDFRLVVSGPEVTQGVGTGTIHDDDPLPAVAVSDAEPATEGGTASFAIGLSARSGRDVTVAFTTANGSATADQDYTARSGRLTIPAGSTGVTLGVQLLDDSADEPAESFALRLSAPSAATLGHDTAVATILDNDEPPAVGAPPPPGAPVQPRPPALPGLPILPPTTTGSAVSRLVVGSPRLRQPRTGIVTISCPQAAGGCSGQVTLFSRPNTHSAIKQLRKERKLGQRKFVLAAGATQTLAFALSRSDRSLLERAGRINVRAYAVTKDASGRSDVRTATGILLRRTAHSSRTTRARPSSAAGQRLDVAGGTLGAVVGGLPVA
jgi:hypothetical protein